MFFYVLENEKLVPFLERKPHKSKEFDVVGNIYDDSYEFMSKLEGKVGPVTESVKLVNRVKNGAVLGKKFVPDTDPETKDIVVLIGMCNAYTEGKLVTTHKKGTPCFHNGHVVDPGDFDYHWNNKGETYRCKICGVRLMSPRSPYYATIAEDTDTNYPFHLKEGKMLDDYVTFEINKASHLSEERFDMFGGCEGTILKWGMSIYTIRYNVFAGTPEVDQIESTDSGVQVEKVFSVSDSHKLIFK